MIENVVIGSEHDENLKSALFLVLKKMGAKKISEMDALAGSQDVSIHEFLVKNEIIKVESETYIGLSLVGSKNLIMEIENNVRLILKGVGI
ncbi:hypothetical protein AAHN93_14790 [Vandammella animalimorsus]|uniref:hypothetical protein n=1 Tax=Vandammella animalimorsus TaxID=2029117 RepID=UPI0031BB335C